MIQGEEGIKPYILGNKGYLLLPWLMVLFKQFANVCHIVLETLYKRHPCQGRNVVKTHLALKKVSNTPTKTNLDVLFLFDLMVCCCILYNMILNEKDLDIETLMLQLDFENVGNSMHIPNHKEVHEQNFKTNEINNEFEPQLQGVEL
jgi:hypothetical protein